MNDTQLDVKFLCDRIKDKDKLDTEEWNEYKMLDRQYEQAVETADNGCRK